MAQFSMEIMRLTGSVPRGNQHANAFDSDRAACIEAGMDDHMSKPVTTDKMSDLFSRHLAGADLPVEISRPVVLLDDSYRLSLIENLGEEQFNLLVKDFRTSLPALLAEVETAFDGRGQDLDHLLHTLKGAAQTLGYLSLAEAAQIMRNDDAGSQALSELRSQIHALAA